MNYKITTLNPQKFLVRFCKFSNGIAVDENNRTIPEYWDTCFCDKTIERLKKAVGAGRKDLYGLCREIEDADYFEYGIGIAVDDAENTALRDFLQNGYELCESDPSEYVVFDCIGEDAKCLKYAWKFFYSEFLTKEGYRKKAQPDFELYRENAPAENFCELWIPIEKI